MTPKLTNEMRQALALHSDRPIPVRDEQTQQLYVLVPQNDYLRMHEDYVRRELHVAFDQADRGEWSELDIDSVLAEAHRRHTASQQDAL